MVVRILLIIVLFLGIITISCQREISYEEVVRKELASGVRHDSLFLGYKLGMPRDEFYRYSWQLNKKKLVREGPGNQTVQYDIEELPHPASMNFYPDFRNDKIYRMRVIFNYKGWAPWNKDLSSDSLLIDVKELMEKWYGAGFMEVKKPQIGNSLVKVDGNREVMIFKADETAVNVYITDLTNK